MFRKLGDIKTLLYQHKPHIFGLAEANVQSNHDQIEISIPGYTLHLPASISNPDLENVARVAIYVSNSIKVKQRQDLEDPLLQLICLEAGLPGKSKSLYIIGYRQWQLAGQKDSSSSTLCSQLARWKSC